MKIGVYTDVHCAYTSSILPLQSSTSKYTTRLQMVVDTFRWMYSEFKSQSVDLIVNCGDLFDTFKLRAEEISAMAEALSFNTQIPEYHIIGNHELMDKRRNFYATALLDNYQHINVVNQPLKLSNGLSFLPYMSWEDAQDSLPLLRNSILFSHIDIEGSQVTPQYVLDTGVTPQKLSELFRLVVNGHIHVYQKLRNNVYNIGATTSTSFSDDPEYVPGIAIIDTTDYSIRRISNPYAILFRRISVNNIAELADYCNTLSYPCALRCDIPNQLRKDAEMLLKDCEHVIASRLITNSNDVCIDDSPMEDINIELKTDVDKEFIAFLKCCPDLKYPLSDYLSVVNQLQEDSEC